MRLYYEEERPRRIRKKKRRGALGILWWILIRLLLLAVLCAVALYALPVGLFMIEPEAQLSPSSQLPSSRINILLLGVDRLSEGSQRSDTVMIATIGYGEFAMTSVLRDTMVNIPGYGRGKLNAAYSHGGAELTMRTLNENFGLNITKYALVDFTSLADIINAMGGVDIAITQAEQTDINRNLVDSWKVFKKLGYSQSDTSPVALDFAGADENGYVAAHLDGFQALAYARIRRIDSDFTRTHRQRKLLHAAMLAVRQRWYNPIMLTRLIQTAFSQVDTNLNPLEIVSLALKAATCAEPRQLRLPVDGSYTDDGSALTDVDYGKNLEAFKAFAY